MIAITKKIIAFNFSAGNDIKYIVVHDTGNKAPGSNPEAHYKFFNSGDKASSAHYIVGDKSIYQLVEDKNASWHCGDGNGRYGITNHNSIGIEICVNADSNYEQSIKNALDLAFSLMKKYAVPIEKVVRHYDASHKLCPKSMSDNNWYKWTSFKKQLGELVSNSIPYKAAYGLVTSNSLNIRKGAGLNHEVIGTLRHGERVRLANKVGDWWSINIGGQDGFISSQYISQV